MPIPAVRPVPGPRFGTVFCLAALWAATLYAGDGTARQASVSPAQHATGGIAANGTGIDALFSNPAGLFGPRGGGIQVAIGRFGAYAGGSLLRFDLYNNAFTGGNVIDRPGARELVSDWFGEGGATVKMVASEVSVVPLAVRLGGQKWSFAAAVRARSSAGFGVNGGWMDLLLIGTGEDRELPMDARARYRSTVDFTVGVARQLNEGRLSVGVAPRLILGADYTDVEFNSTAHISGEEIRHDFDY